MIDWLASLPPADAPAWWYFTAVGLGVLVTGVAKSGFGGGVGILAVPLIANAVPAGRAIGLMLPILLAADAVAIAQHRRSASWRWLTPAVAGSIVGVGLGTLVLVRIEGTPSFEPVLKGLVGVVCLALVGLQALRLMGLGRVRLPGRAGWGAGAGMTAGVVSTLAHAAGPVMSLYWLEQRLPKATLVGTLAVFFGVLNAAKLPTYVTQGLVTSATLAESALFATLVPAGAAVGLWLHKRAPERPFVVVMYLGAAAASVWLLVQAGRALGG